MFCCFAPIGLLGDIQSLGRAPWWHIAIQTVLTGGVAMGYAACGIYARRWFPALIALSIGITLAMRHWLPATPTPVSLDAADVLALRSRLVVVVSMTVATVVLAYVSFLMFILGEGRRSFRAFTEIRLARDIHAALVPVVSGATSGLTWHGTSRPSGEVGGDLVDVVTGTARGWLGCVADVTGHGVAAGVLMGMFKTAVHASVTDARDLGDLITRVNRTLGPLTQSHMFVTCACVQMIGPTQMEYVLAGHPPMLHVAAGSAGRPGGTAWIGNQQLAVGILTNATYERRVLEVQPGDLVVMFTDGLMEVFDDRNEEFGLERLARVVEPLAMAAPLSDIEAAVFDAAKRFGPQIDDQTMLLIRVGK